MYVALLLIHSWLRWLVLFAGVAALGGSVGGVTTRRPWERADDLRSLLLTISLDLQFVVGVILYGVSPITRAALGDIGAAMGDRVLRFYAVEHVVGMLVALALVHVGRVRIRKVADAAQRHRAALVFFGLALVALIVSIPWPGMPGGRALFRGF